MTKGILIKTFSNNDSLIRYLMLSKNELKGYKLRIYQIKDEYGLWREVTHDDKKEDIQTVPKGVKVVPVIYKSYSCPSEFFYLNGQENFDC